jgi:hypothetical protein
MSHPRRRTVDYYRRLNGRVVTELTIFDGHGGLITVVIA